jgi:lipopolysaccharide/colanic/teichoic acid biosynthesis glycosyltransferase
MQTFEAQTTLPPHLRISAFTAFPQRNPNWALKLKRGVDVALGTTLLFSLAPLLLLLGLLIRIESRGPVIYRARRVGKNGTLFWCFKLRTMVADADRLRADLESKNERNGMLFKMADDPRITRIGRVLRKYSADELPQLWNVLRGEMSLVGPRPALPEEVARYKREHFERLLVTPGITGAWQVHARRDPSFDTYIRLDTEYVRNWDFWLDVKIMFRTIGVVFLGTGQ